MPRKKVTRKRKTAKRRTSKRKKATPKRKLAGFTKVGGKYALVFKRGKKLSLGSKRFSKKSGMLTAARKLV